MLSTNDVLASGGGNNDLSLIGNIVQGADLNIAKLKPPSFPYV
jgi:hypothetical protein